MRGYWVRILAGAFAIFVVGYAAVWFVRERVVTHTRSMVRTADPIRIPLAFVPFAIDGQRHGTFQRLTIERDSPRAIRAFNIRVRLADTIDPASLADCRLTTASPDRFELTEGFHCLGSEDSDSGLVPFGEVQFRGPGNHVVVVALLLGEEAVRSLREEGGEVARAQRALLEAEEAAAKAEAERARVEARLKADSIRQAVRSRIEVSPPPSNPEGGTR